MIMWLAIYNLRKVLQYFVSPKCFTSVTTKEMHVLELLFVILLNKTHIMLWNIGSVLLNTVYYGHM